ncbi:MAG: catalase, partial [Gammaproteobacteria bacterium]|nr:catalase [Gammaproteobacteria bacterium]
MNLLPGILASGRQLVDDVQKQSGPAFRRDAHAKAHGCLRAEFTVRHDLPEALRNGVFVPGRTYKAWVRFSNGNAYLQPDATKDARGMAIKLMGVQGPKLLTSPDEANAQTQDFLMINYPVFFNRDPAEYE